MNIEAFYKALNESRNGAYKFFRHPLARSFIYSDGMQEVAEAGCYWMLDIMATECAPLVRQERRQALFAVAVENGKAVLALSFDDDHNAWTRKIDHTDMPNGTFKFVMGFDGTYASAYLLSEY